MAHNHRQDGGDNGISWIGTLQNFVHIDRGASFTMRQDVKFSL